MEYVNSLEASGKYKHHQTISQNYPPEVQHTPFFRGELLNFRGVVPKIHVIILDTAVRTYETETFPNYGPVDPRILPSKLLHTSSGGHDFRFTQVDDAL